LIKKDKIIEVYMAVENNLDKNIKNLKLAVFNTYAKVKVGISKVFLINCNKKNNKLLI